MRKLLGFLLTGFVALPAFAQGNEEPKCHCNVDSLTIGVGYFDPFENNYDSAVASLEYRGKTFLWDIVRPVVGGLANSDGAAMGYVGVAFDFVVGDGMYITPHTNVGLYSDGNDSADLGGSVEFKSGVEFSYQLKDESRIGLSIDHISNAGIYDDNPGVETVTVTYSMPISSLMGN